MVDRQWDADVTVYSEYGQFQVGDRNSPLEFEWDLGAEERHMAVARDVVSIATSTMFGDVDVRLEVWAAEPPREFASADHVVEASIYIPSGLVSVTSVSSDIKLDARLAPGWFRIRASGSNLASGAGGVAVDHGDDRYLAQVWPDTEREPSILKAWSGWPT